MLNGVYRYHPHREQHEEKHYDCHARSEVPHLVNPLASRFALLQVEGIQGSCS